LPLTVDFLSAKFTYRRHHASVRRETLARALGLKNHTTPTIVDATAGLGRDSFMLAALGFPITLLERCPIIQVLLENGMQRAALDPLVAPIIQRMDFMPGDATTHLQQLAPVDLIYLDPMFPARRKSALVKKEMQIFHDVVGTDPDADTLLSLALACATKRVVVKRSRSAGYLGEMTPAFSLQGKSSRFDVYIPKA
jgi:16S rRNA (guanine1516-N2)-methyltransferase